MKLNNSLSPKQKTQLQKASILLLSLLFMGILATQINQDKEIEGLNNLKPKNSLELAENQQESLEQEAEQVSSRLEVNAASEHVEMEEVEAKEVQKERERERNVANLSKKAAKTVASPTAVAKTRSAVAYSSMNMQVQDYTGKLSWASSFQRNIKSFAIERSIDDKEYTEIGRIAGEGQGEFSQENLYQFEDTSLMFVQMPSVLYRIKQIGVNGDQDYSEAIEYELGLPEGLYASVKVSDKEMLKIHYAATSSGPVSYQILDAFGTSVSQGNLQGEYEPKSLSIKVKNWEKGAYYLKLEAEKYSYMEAFEL